MTLANQLYNTVFKRNSVFVGTIFFGAFAFGMGFDSLTQKLWDSHNRGKQWQDIRDRVTKESSD